MAQCGQVEEELNAAAGDSQTLWQRAGTQPQAELLSKKKCVPEMGIWALS